VPPVSHFIYIPMVLMIGIVIGFVLGGRAARDADAARRRADEAKAARRAARDAARRESERSE
jgi:hypothetical protein